MICFDCSILFTSATECKSLSALWAAITFDLFHLSHFGFTCTNVFTIPAHPLNIRIYKASPISSQQTHVENISGKDLVLPRYSPSPLPPASPLPCETPALMQILSNGQSSLSARWSEHIIEQNLEAFCFFSLSPSSQGDLQDQVNITQNRPYFFFFCAGVVNF